MTKPVALLGGLTADQFLKEYWHKKPLLIRGAMTDVGPHVDFEWLKKLAQDEDVESRLIECRGGDWVLEHGPFRPQRFRRLPETDWTILVQNVNHHLPHIDRILWQFDFVPFARLDDLMISYAPPGGTVGPHFDSYDVFLLQVGGRKSWKISSQDDVRLIEGAPLKILQHFECEEEFVLEHGDMLYLPPRYAHYGVAIDPGMTYSIGFRAPSAQEVATQFLVHLQDRICLDGMYADPDLVRQTDPARIGEPMIDQVMDMLSRVKWGREEVADFLGHYLTEPKAHVFYDAPEEDLDEAEFMQRARASGLRLDARSQILYQGDAFYCNGEKLDVALPDVAVWQQFANLRAVSGAILADTMQDVLYEGYQAGYWQFANPVAQ